MDKSKQEDKLVEHAVGLLNEQYGGNSEFNAYFDSDEPITIGGINKDGGTPTWRNHCEDAAGAIRCRWYRRPTLGSVS